MLQFLCRTEALITALVLSVSLVGTAHAKVSTEGTDFSHSTQSAFHANYAIRPGQSKQDVAAIIHSNFAAVIEENFARGSSAHIQKLIDNLSERELQDLASAYTKALGGQHANVLDSLAQKLDGKRLARVAGAFGYVPVSIAVSTHASSDVQVAFEEKAKRSAATPGGGKATIFASPTIDMTIYEIYLEYRTAPIGSLGPSAAIAETSIFSGAHLWAAWQAGTYIGTGINALINTYDPQLGDAIGGTIYGMVENIYSAGNSIQQGHYEQGLDNLLGGSIGARGEATGNYSGDYGVSGAYNEMMHNNHICGDFKFQTAGSIHTNANCDPNP
ncbi:hypothetical protein [Collimonas pratensis]|uniref:DUF2059 domain-containing protein n=1 Tax=Collimonas pratensis TaxID=279113 RepID=A0A127Q920_9BURK|nr:hypothetical protein [Collimonas pratensis]AMP06559.1 hypothetical protein CPter91_4244 [Collimonas pratensis]